ncbi:MAG: peptidoglycan DD-metalloendopeptidase family protein [Saprospiraceae bacterium]|nr:peptidoglycan DD-metalloendopeptidase family protein [Saprospiraceae bacterium]
MKRKEASILNICIVISAVIAGYFILHYLNVSETPQEETVIESVEPEYKYGFDKNAHHFEKHTLGFNQNLGDLLLYQGIAWDSILKLDQISSNVFSIRKFRAKKPITLVKENECEAPLCVIYEPNKFTFIKYFIKDKVKIDVVKRDYDIVIESAAGEITSSLWGAMQENGLGNDIIDKMEDAFASSVDFYHTQKGDKFKLIYERKYIDGKSVDTGEILAASYKNEQGEHHAVFYENENYEGFYDLEGHPALGKFLRAPLKNSRISSRYNLRRFHPIKKRTIPHLGTDYAAPIGTPIYAVGSGVIEVAGYTKNNGKYVKIRHDDVYKTQYLHMNRIAPGIKKGVRVKQGQKIGEVGKTGLATGPHVCFRFWKNGKQVNHLRLNFPPQDPLPADQLEDFFKKRDVLLNILNQVPYPNEEPNNTLAFNNP